MTAHTQGFQKELFEEMKLESRKTMNLSYLYNGYYYIPVLKQVKIIPFILEKKAFSKRRNHARLQRISKRKNISN
jgi:hypothetical protein